MRLKSRIAAVTLSAALFLGFLGTAPAAQAAPAVLAKDEMRGVWVTTVLNLDYPFKPTTSVAAMKSEADALLESALEMGMNAVFLQVRPTADAFYKSGIFPWSYYLTGTAGKAPADGFDPLAYWVDEAHKRGMELHAWVNPYRITHSTPKIGNVSELPSGHPAKDHPSWVVSFGGQLYFNPSIPEVRQLITDGVAEIVRNYAVDGVQFDDYFYPGNIDDSAAFETYGKSFGDVASWRRNNVDEVIKEVNQAVKDIREDCSFGVSPSGIWANSTTAYGSDTRGNESYHSAYADTRKWVKLGWLDYIAPQIYWEIGYPAADYEILLKWWDDVCEGTDVDLYIAHAAYRVDPKSSSEAWRSADELVRQLDLSKTMPNVKGSLFFRLGTMLASPAVPAALKEYYESNSGTRTIFSPRTVPLAINVPGRDITENVASYYIMGSSDPSLPLYINGEEITNRTASGFFSKLVPLQKGANVITATQGAKTVSRTITRAAASSSASPPSIEAAGIVSSSVRPQTNQYLNPGQVYRLGCTAPIGATVTVSLAGKTYKLTPSTTSKPDNNKIYTTSFNYNYTAPALSGTGKISAIGTPVYTMTYNGKTAKATAPGLIKNINDKAPVYAQITSPTAWIYPSNSSDGGSSGELTIGMEDYIVRTSGNWVKLGMGEWIYDDNIKITESSNPKMALIQKCTYSQYGKWDYIHVSANAKTVSRVNRSDDILTYTIYNSTLSRGIAPSVPPDSPFESAWATEKGGNVTLHFRLRSGALIDGWYLKMLEDGTQELAIKKHPSISTASIGRPLTGIRVMLDAGHGGSASGALGPLGADMPEKTLALAIAQKARRQLESLGAEVVMARTIDKYMELEERLEISRSARPDLFLSIHLNSMAVTTDSSNIKGVLSLYREPNGKGFAESLHAECVNTIFRQDKGVKSQNLYVCRGYWSPSVLLECAFINNPDEFEWLVAGSGADDLAGAIARGVVNYFS